MKVKRKIPLVFGYNYEDVVGSAEIQIRDDGATAILITMPKDSKAVTDMLVENTPIAMSFVYWPSPERT